MKRYGIWAGNPRGVSGDPSRCIESLWDLRWERQCSRKRGHGPRGEYCRQHGAIAEKMEGSTEGSGEQITAIRI